MPKLLKLVPVLLPSVSAGAHLTIGGEKDDEKGLTRVATGDALVYMRMWEISQGSQSTRSAFSM